MTKSKKTTLLRLLELKKLAERIINNFPNEPLPSGWQPIDSAPRDGTDILVCCTRRPDGSDMFADGDYSSFGIFVHRVSWWCEEDKPSEGEWVVYNSMTQDPRCHFEPTHWMPIPEPPKS